MKRLVLVALAFATAACDDARDVPVDKDVIVHEDTAAQADIDECPRADGQPCK